MKALDLVITIWLVSVIIVCFAVYRFMGMKYVGIRKKSTIFLALLQLFCVVALTIKFGIYFAPIMVFASYFLLINNARIYYGRLQLDYLRRVTLRTFTSIVVALFLVILTLIISNYYFEINFNLLLASAWIIYTLLLFTNSMSVMLGSRLPIIEEYDDSELPTISVLLPARNETKALEECLEILTVNSYPKIEIIALDDCSLSKRTNQIIKDYAQVGVRFIQGKNPPNDWLAKNYAYEQLVDAASGKYLLFLGVDVRIGVHTLSEIVSYATFHNKKMVSIMPKRSQQNLSSTIFSPLRYWWEFVVPKWHLNKPPVLSTCWLIESDLLKQAGGFKAYKRQIIPEESLARHASLSGQYDFVFATEGFDVSTTKQLSAQINTAIRTRYAQFHKRPESVALNNIQIGVFWLIPYCFLVQGMISGFDFLHAVAIVVIIINHLMELLVQIVSNSTNIVITNIFLPIRMIVEIILVNISMFKYEFGSVYWKGRNICLPVMHLKPKQIKK